MKLNQDSWIMFHLQIHSNYLHEPFNVVPQLLKELYREFHQNGKKINHEAVTVKLVCCLHVSTKHLPQFIKKLQIFFLF